MIDKYYVVLAKKNLQDSSTILFNICKVHEKDDWLSPLKITATQVPSMNNFGTYFIHGFYLHVISLKLIGI